MGASGQRWRSGHCSVPPESRNAIHPQPPSAPTPRTCYKVWPGTQNLRSLRQATETKGSRPEAKVAEHRGQGRVEGRRTRTWGSEAVDATHGGHRVGTEGTGDLSHV